MLYNFQGEDCKFIEKLSSTGWLKLSDNIPLYLNFEKSSWKNQVRQTGQISKLIFADYTGSINQVWNRLNMHFVELDFLNWFFRYQVDINKECIIL